MVVFAPAASARLEKIEGAFDVGADELARAQDASVHMALGGEVHDEVRVELVEHGIHAVHVGDVHPAKRVVRK